MQKQFGDAFPKESAADMISTFWNFKRVRDVHVHHLHLTDEGHGGDGLCPPLVLKVKHMTAERSIEKHPSGSPPCQISNQKDSSAVLCLAFSPFALADHDCSEKTCTASPSPRQQVPAPASCETSFGMSESALQMKFGSVSGIKSSRRGRA